nr:monocopper oxidase-like protein sks1 [Quercus suber]
MALFGVSLFTLFSLLFIALFPSLCFTADPSIFYDLRLSYITASPLGVPQQVIAVNGKFPGPLINSTTNDNLNVNVHNDLDENLLMTWSGIQMRRDSWQDGVLGTNCPIHPKRNWTYQFQMKDQIGSFFYFPSLNFQRASGGFGPIIINNRVIIAIPFAQPDGDITITIGDWYIQNHTALRSALDAGNGLAMPDGVLINGKGPYRYNNTLVPDGIEYETIQVDPGKTYRVRVHNVGISTSLNFRIQNHFLLLAETEGYYTTQQNFSSLDIHVGQSCSFLVTMDQNASSDYYIVASARFVNESLWQRVTGVAVLRYSNSKGPAAGPLPDPPNDFYDKSWSMNQALSIRQNVSASGARPNPQGAYKLDFPDQPLNRTPRVDRSVINATYKGFIEIIFQNNDTVMQSFHVDGYSFFIVGMGTNEWTVDSRSRYNKWDAISRSTTQVFPGGWTAVLISLDNVGVWNIRTENLDRWYLGQETYMKIINPQENGATEMDKPENVLYCGALQYLAKDENNSAGSVLRGNSKLLFTLLVAFFALINISS